jgi:hypothetical protein
LKLKSKTGSTIKLKIPFGSSIGTGIKYQNWIWNLKLDQKFGIGSRTRSKIKIEIPIGLGI